MAELKTKENDESPLNFIEKIDSQKKQEDSLILLKLFQKETGFPPKMWGDSIIGFGKYHYKSDRSTQEGDWPLTGFSPRKQAFSIYIMPGASKYSDLLATLGKHKASKGSCIYINKLEDVNLKVLAKIIKKSLLDMKKLYP